MIDLGEPAYKAIMNHADDRTLRREVYLAYVTRASDQGPTAGQWDNGPLIMEMLDLRYRLARLLGFENWVEYALSRRMADTPDKVLAFLQQLAERAAPAASRQFAELRDFARENGAELPLEAWDVAYWSERLRESELHLSDRELRPYFPLDNMLDALRHLSSCLFGVHLVADDTIASWHPDVLSLIHI